MFNWIPFLFSLPILYVYIMHAIAGGNERILNFQNAKLIAVQVHEENPTTIYCNCKYSGKTVDLKSCGYHEKNDPARARRLEWEHVVPAENFGRSFAEWREGADQCKRGRKKFKGRKCAQTNPIFSKMEADLYNLWPEIGELNGLRSNYSMAELGAEKAKTFEFGECKVKIQDRKFEPMPNAKGRVARVYMYMDSTYPGHGIISRKNTKLFEAWDKLHPPDLWECRRAKKIRELQGNPNLILKEKCRVMGFKDY